MQRVAIFDAMRACLKSVPHLDLCPFFKCVPEFVVVFEQIFGMIIFYHFVWSYLKEYFKSRANGLDRYLQISKSSEIL